MENKCPFCPEGKGCGNKHCPYTKETNGGN